MVIYIKRYDQATMNRNVLSSVKRILVELDQGLSQRQLSVCGSPLDNSGTKPTQRQLLHPFIHESETDSRVIVGKRKLNIQARYKRIGQKINIELIWIWFLLADSFSFWIFHLFSKSHFFRLKQKWKIVIVKPQDWWHRFFQVSL